MPGGGNSALPSRKASSTFCPPLSSRAAPQVGQQKAQVLAGGREEGGGLAVGTHTARPQATAPQGTWGRGGAHTTRRQDPRAPAWLGDSWAGSPVFGPRAGCHTETILSMGDRERAGLPSWRRSRAACRRCCETPRNAAEKDLKAGPHAP